MNTTTSTQNKAHKSGTAGNISAARNGETPTRPALDHMMIGAWFAYPCWLDAARDRKENRNEPHVLPTGALATVITGVTTDTFKAFSPINDLPQMVWVDTVAGNEGVGAVSLVAHVLKITEGEAAYRLARFVSMKRNIPFGNLIAPKAA